MHNNVKSFVNKGKLKLALLAVSVVGLVAPAAAQTTTGGSSPIDFGPAVTATKTDITAFFTENATALVGLMVVGIVFGIGWRLIKRGAKTIG